MPRSLSSPGIIFSFRTGFPAARITAFASIRDSLVTTYFVSVLKLKSMASSETTSAPKPFAWSLNFRRSSRLSIGGKPG